MKDLDAGVLIIGGGISGLVTAWSLLEADHELDVRLLEASSRLGGAMGTEDVNGFLFERGPNGFLDNVSDTLDLVEALGLSDRLITSSPAASRRCLLKGGRLHTLPTSAAELLRSPLLSVRGKLRVLSEPFRAPGYLDSEDSVASFGRRRLGDEATATFLDPLVTGIYAGDMERLSLQSAFPRIAELEREHRSLARGMLAKARDRRRAQAAAGEGSPGISPPDGGPSRGGRLHSFQRGFEDLVGALAKRLGDRALRDVPVESVRARGDGFEALLRDRSVIRARAVVSAVPAPRAANLVSSWNVDLAAALDEIPYAPVAVVCLGYARSEVGHPLDGFGFLVPRNQGLRTLGAIWVSSIFPGHAPEGHVSLRIMAGGARDPEIVGWSGEDLTDLVIGEMKPILALRGAPVTRKVYRYAQGIPQYNVGHSKRIRRIEGWLRGSSGLFITGNAFRGVGVNDCVREARRIATEVMDCLRRKKSGPTKGARD
ncbi:MAG TPA: protoporphyrinogen oxidase [Planctomycetota bacterium]|nr:protoporphyrinogen oxidase [Planctomycetota bacterium]